MMFARVGTKRVNLQYVITTDDTVEEDGSPSKSIEVYPGREFRVPREQARELDEKIDLIINAPPMAPGVTIVQGEGSGPRPLREHGA